MHFTPLDWSMESEFQRSSVVELGWQVDFEPLWKAPWLLVTMALEGAGCLATPWLASYLVPIGSLAATTIEETSLALTLAQAFTLALGSLLARVPSGVANPWASSSYEFMLALASRLAFAARCIASHRHATPRLASH